MLVTFDQECCLLYKAQLDRYLPPEASEIVISVSGKEREDKRYRPYKRDRDAEEKLLDRFRDPNDPLQILVVTAKLLTGFDAPILQAMYLDKPMRDHTLLQAITRTNRTYGSMKTHGLIVDYLGIFDDVAKSLEFDEEGFRRVVSDIVGLKAKFPEAMQKCLAYFPGVDHSISGYEGLIRPRSACPITTCGMPLPRITAPCPAFGKPSPRTRSCPSMKTTIAGSRRSMSRSNPPPAPGRCSGMPWEPRPSN